MRRGDANLKKVIVVGDTKGKRLRGRAPILVGRLNKGLVVLQILRGLKRRNEPAAMEADHPLQK